MNIRGVGQVFCSDIKAVKNQRREYLQLELDEKALCRRWDLNFTGSGGRRMKENICKKSIIY